MNGDRGTPDGASQRPVLVTGASGFIGVRLVRRLMKRRAPVTCLARPGSRVEALRSAGAQLITGDVTNLATIERALAESNAGAVFHLAGLVKAHRQRDLMAVNAGGVDNVSLACAARALPPVLIIVSSLSAAGPCPSETARVESDAPEPVSDYGRSKLAGEQAAARHAATVPISIVRPPIVFGPGDRGVLELFRPIARWGLHVVPGRGDNHYSLIHVDDLVEGILLIAEKGERLHQGESKDGTGVYYIAGEDQPTFTELGLAIAAALDAGPPVSIHIPAPLLKLVGVGGDVTSWIRRRPGRLGRDKIGEAAAGSWTCSAAKARAGIGWSGAASLASRLSQTARWYRNAGWL